MVLEKSLVRRDILFGAYYFGNYFFRRVLFLGGLVFFLSVSLVGDQIDFLLML